MARPEHPCDAGCARERIACCKKDFVAVPGAIAGALGIEPPPLRICPIERRWGSHTLSGRILLDDALIAARRDCIDYVIVHELCHAIEPNHSLRFLRLLPGWERRKELLERTMA